MWIYLTLGAVLLWSFVNIADNFLVERNKKIGHPIGSLVIFSSIFGFIAAAAIYLYTKTSLILPTKEIVLLLVAGLCNVSWIVFYLKALPDEDVSSVVPWFLASPFFGYILGYLFLGEQLGMMQLIGGSIVLVGGFILSLKKHEEKLRLRWKLIGYMTIASFLIACWEILFKFVARDSGFWVSSFWEHIGLGIGGVLIILFVRSYRKGFSDILRKDGKLVFTVSFFSETATIIGNLLANYAILLVPVSMVLLLEVVQPAVVFVLGLIGTCLAPHIVREDVSSKALIQKSCAIGIMIIGALLLI